jgi:hypothetical protein
MNPLAELSSQVMENIESKLHSPGVIIYRAKGNLTAENIEEWREALEKFVKENDKRGACGALIDVCEIEGLSAEALDTLMELLGDPEEAIRDIKMRFALIGIKPFTQRFLRESMPLEEIKHIRARFFHEVAEDEALAWLQAMVTTAEEEKAGDKKDEPALKSEPTKKEEPAKKEAPTPKQEEKAEAKSPEAPKEKEPEKKREPLKLLPTLLKGSAKSEDKKPEPIKKGN